MSQKASDTAVLRAGGQHVWYDPALLPSCDPRLFDPAWLRAEGKITGTSEGRNTAYFLHHAGTDMVLRHYYRGGLIGRLNKDLFLRQPVPRSRAMAEFTLLTWMRAQGLPVPRPVAARFSGAGFFYRADILVQIIPQTETLAKRLSTVTLETHIWQGVGHAVGRMHAGGVHHSDLNCRNILIDAADRIWLIDFDKCARRPAGPWMQENLARLHRSLEKESKLRPGLHWNEDAWAALLQGYAMSPAPP